MAWSRSAGRRPSRQALGRGRLLDELGRGPLVRDGDGPVGAFLRRLAGCGVDVADALAGVAGSTGTLARCGPASMRPL
jgi:hypothetical protein